MEVHLTDDWSYNMAYTTKHSCDGHYFEIIAYETTGTGSRIQIHAEMRRVREIGQRIVRTYEELSHD